ncbi:MAG: endonuclease MutS2 [Oscillospiraceae bacterium]
MKNNFKTLELHKILEMLSNEASNAKTKEMAMGILPSQDLSSVRGEIQKTSDALSLSSKFGTPYFMNFKDVSGSLNRAKSGSSLSLKELLEIGQMLSQIKAVTDWYSQCSGIETSLTPLFSSLTPNKTLTEKIANSIISEEEISDNASAELASIRRKMLQLGSRIRENLDKMIHSSAVQKCLQESIVTMRDGRFVLPVKSEHKNTIQGLVHDTSSSGATLFIEPISVVEANNDIRVLKGREIDEINRIIAELSNDCAIFADSLIDDYNTCAELNLYFSKANLAARMKASCPEISDDGIINLRKARHPLINPKDVVPVDISIGEKYQALIITGPNTGGKTVILKTVGLLTLMVMCGLLIPVSDGSKISIFENILVDIGDEQSIENSLSTFSSHMNRVVEILKIADENSLVLLDELGSGTDPVEGSALAISIIEKLKDYGSKILVTTHYQELKIYAIQNDKIENASCEFNVETLRPTYRLIIGSPGKSNAFAISSRLGISDDVINYAEALVSSEDKRFEEVVAQLENVRQELENKNAEISKLLQDERLKSEKLEKEIETFNKNKEAELEKSRVEAMRIIENVRLQSDNLIDELAEIRKQKEKENFAEMSIAAKSKTKSTLDKLYKDANPVQKNPNENYKLPRKLKQGDSVYVVDIAKNGIVASDEDANGNIFVQVGIMKTKVSIGKLRLVDAEKVTFKSKKISTKGITGKMERKVEMELDIRGNNVDEGIHELGMFIDNAIMSGVGIFTIIHGKGTGVLRTAVHRYLKSSNAVKSFRLGVYGEGEDGVTIVELK